MTQGYRIGVISDTHGLLRPWAREQLVGCDTLLHAGDIGKPAVIDELRDIAPLTVIRGNIDKWADDLPDIEAIELRGRYFYMLHDLKTLDLDPAAAGFDVVVSGHSHKPLIERRDGVLYLNPGSAGPRRFTLPIALAIVTLTDAGVEAEIREMPPDTG
ncbi:MAG: metallophosphoesterase family protein [Pseudomonadota bacterium]